VDKMMRCLFFWSIIDIKFHMTWSLSNCLSFNSTKIFPYIFFAFLKSVKVVGLFNIFPFFSICSNESSEGLPNITYSLLAFSAASTSLFVNFLCKFSTVYIIIAFFVSCCLFFFSMLLGKF
jgi:hypothetical protein